MVTERRGGRGRGNKGWFGRGKGLLKRYKTAANTIVPVGRLRPPHLPGTRSMVIKSSFRPDSCDRHMISPTVNVYCVRDHMTRAWNHVTAGGGCYLKEWNPQHNLSHNTAHCSSAFPLSPTSPPSLSLSLPHLTSISLSFSMYLPIIYVADAFPFSTIIQYREPLKKYPQNKECISM